MHLYLNIVLLSLQAVHSLSSLYETALNIDAAVNFTRAKNCVTPIHVPLEEDVNIYFCASDNLRIESSAAFIFAGYLECTAKENTVCKDKYDIDIGHFKKVIVKATQIAALEDRHYFPKSSIQDEINAFSALKSTIHSPRFFGTAKGSQTLPSSDPHLLIMEYISEWTLAAFLRSNQQGKELMGEVVQWIASEIYDIIDEFYLNGVIHTDLHFENLMFSFSAEPHVKGGVTPLCKVVPPPTPLPVRFPIIKAIDFNQVKLIPKQSTHKNDQYSKGVALAQAAARLDVYQIGPSKVNAERIQSDAQAFSKAASPSSKEQFLRDVQAGLNGTDGKNADAAAPPTSWFGVFLKAVDWTHEKTS